MEEKKAAVTYFGTNIRVPAACVREYQVRRLLGEGLQGTVWQACRERRCRYALKVTVIHPGEPADLPYVVPNTERVAVPVESFEQEAKIAELAGQHGIGPRVYGWWICKDDVAVDHSTDYWLGFLLMQRLDTSLGRWALQHPQLYLQVWREPLHQWALAAMRALHALGWAHGDLRAANMGLLLDKHGDPVHLYLIDFGGAQELNPRLERFDAEKLQEALQDLDQRARAIIGERPVVKPAA